jgi:hypothetical protein
MDINGVELLKLIEVTSFGGSFGLSMADCLDELIALSNYQPDKQNPEGSREEHDS